jgi:hypothetical protein
MTTYDSHIKDYYEYHAEQERYFDQLNEINTPLDVGLDEQAMLWLDRMHEEHGTWNMNVWSQEGF